MVEPVGNRSYATVPVFFIIGRPRSGTTLLRMLFEAHPQILVPPESPFIIGLYKKYGKVTSWDESMIRSFTEDLFRQRYFDKWLIGKEELFHKLMETAGENTFQAMFRKVCLAYSSIYDKSEIRWIGDKNPAYSLYVKRIHRLFPEARIIHITRDYRDNYLSLIRVNFEVPILPLVIYRWKFAIHRIRKLKDRYPDLVFSIRYEDLATDPEVHFREICGFLGIPYDPDVMTFYRKKSEAESAYADSAELEQIHQSLFNPISTQRINLWQKEMSDRQIRIADLVAGKTAEKAGYRRKYTSFDLGLYLWILPVLVYATIMYRLILFGDHLPYRMRNSLNSALGIFLKVYWKFNRRRVNPL